MDLDKQKLLDWLVNELTDHNPHIPETETSKAFVRALSLVHRKIKSGEFDKGE